MYHRKSSKKSTDKSITMRLQAQYLTCFSASEIVCAWNLKQSNFHGIFEVIFDFSSDLWRNYNTRKIENDIKYFVKVRLFRISSTNQLGGTETRLLSNFEPAISVYWTCQSVFSTIFGDTYDFNFYWNVDIYNFQNACPRKCCGHFCWNSTD